MMKTTLTGERRKFEILLENRIIGKLNKKAKLFPFLCQKRIGGFRVGYLKQFLSNLKDSDIVGVYTKNGELQQLHSQKWCVAPIIEIDKVIDKTNFFDEYGLNYDLIKTRKHKVEI